MKEKFSINGMTCTACSSGIERTLNKLDGVDNAEVSLMAERLTIEYDENKISREEIKRSVIRLGYGIEEYDENALKRRKPQPDKLKKRFLVSLLFLLPLMYFSMGGMLS